MTNPSARSNITYDTYCIFLVIDVLKIDIGDICSHAGLEIVYVQFLLLFHELMRHKGMICEVRFFKSADD